MLSQLIRWLHRKFLGYEVIHLIPGCTYLLIVDKNIVPLAALEVFKQRMKEGGINFAILRVLDVEKVKMFECGKRGRG